MKLLALHVYAETKEGIRTALMELVREMEREHPDDNAIADTYHGEERVVYDYDLVETQAKDVFDAKVEMLKGQGWKR